VVAATIAIMTLVFGAALTVQSGRLDRALAQTEQDARERARKLLTRARALADQAGDAETAREAQRYLTLLK
jgi:hypothetical protein